MKSGKSEFPVEINRLDIVDITNRMQATYIQDFAMQLNGPDLATALTLRALEDWLRDRRVEPDFKVVLK